MPNRLLTKDEFPEAFREQARVWREQWRQGEHGCLHCWHLPRVWQGPLPVPRHCCWCGVTEGPRHGPYAER